MTVVPAQAQRGPLLDSFETQPAHTRALGRLRQTVALGAAAASAGVWLGRLPVPVALVATAGTLAALAWWRVGTRDVRRAESEPPDGLWLHAAGLLRREGGNLEWLEWGQVTRVTIDEERLRIRLHRTGSNDVYLSGHYPGHAIEEVANALARGAGVPGPYAQSAQGSQSAHDDLQ